MLRLKPVQDDWITLVDSRTWWPPYPVLHKAHWCCDTLLQFYKGSAPSADTQQISIPSLTPSHIMCYFRGSRGHSGILKPKWLVCPYHKKVMPFDVSYQCTERCLKKEAASLLYGLIGLKLFTAFCSQREKWCRAQRLIVGRVLAEL